MNGGVLFRENIRPPVLPANQADLASLNGKRDKTLTEVVADRERANSPGP